MVLRFAEPLALGRSDPGPVKTRRTSYQKIRAMVPGSPSSALLCFFGGGFPYPYSILFYPLYWRTHGAGSWTSHRKALQLPGLRQIEPPRQCRGQSAFDGELEGHEGPAGCFHALCKCWRFCFGWNPTSGWTRITGPQKWLDMNQWPNKAASLVSFAGADGGKQMTSNQTAHGRMGSDPTASQGSRGARVLGHSGKDVSPQAGVSAFFFPWRSFFRCKKKRGKPKKQASLLRVPLIFRH